MSKRNIAAALALIAIALLLATFFSKHPSNDRDWALDQVVLPTAEFNGDSVTIHNIRNFTYRSKTDFTPTYYDASFDLGDIERVWYVSEPFDKIGAAHTFLSFEFEGNRFISISAEIRKEKGESFSPLKGILRNYELMYVVGDERDLIKLRSNYRKDNVYVYPLTTALEDARKIFVDMLERANALKDTPEFYNTIWNSCMTNIIAHYEAVTSVRLPYTREVLMPANGDALLYRKGLIDTSLPFEEARARFLVNQRAEMYADSEDFSVRIRDAE